MNGHNIMVEEGGMGVPMEINYRSQNPNAQQYLSPDIIVNPPVLHSNIYLIKCKI